MPTPSAAESSTDFEVGIGRLPPYTRSLLKVPVVLSVTLASTTLPVKRVMELATGTIIPFRKSCEEPLRLYVGDQPVAEGEAVKVGDKFGIRVQAVVMPPEQFHTLPGKSAQG